MADLNITIKKENNIQLSESEMVFYKVYRKDYKLKQGRLLGVLVERRKDLRGQTQLDSGLKWAKLTFGSSLENKQSIFIVPKKLELGDGVGKNIFSKDVLANVLGFYGSTSKKLTWTGVPEVAEGEQNDLPPDGIVLRPATATSCMQFYGLEEKPFETVSDPEFIYFTSNYCETVTAVLDALENLAGLILITGEPGVGKTTLIRYLRNRLVGNVKMVFIPYTTVTFKEFLRILLRELGLEDTGETEKDLLGQLNNYLSQRLGEDETLALFIDEAQTLQEEALGKLWKLLGASRRIQIVLTGQPELEEKLAIQKSTSLRHKIATRCKVEKLCQRESKEYIDYRLKLVGSNISGIFTPGAIAMIIAYARGIPRVINIVCDNALLKGYFSSRRRVDKNIVSEAIMELEGPRRFPVGGNRVFRTLVRFRSELSSYVQMATSFTHTTFERVVKMICL